MADEGSVDRGIKESSTAPDAKPKNPSTEKNKRGGIFSRLWNGLFRMHGDDYEKRLQHISKEEAAVIVRLKRRSQVWRSRATHFLIFSIILEVIAVGYAIIMTRSVDLNWKMRAYRVSPMFLWPSISFVVYSAVKYFLRMRDRKDQKTLERLRAERQAKIDELKEKTNYYITQQLIQRYDTDPAAKAAAATVLASKLGADSGLKVYLGDELKSNAPRGMSNDVELMESSGLRNRKQMHARSSSAGSSVLRQSNEEMTTSEGAAGPRSREQSQPVIDEHDHVQESSIHDRGWLARIVALLVADDPKQSYALICSNCHMHNGLVKEEEFPYVTYYCPHCHSLNRSRPMEEHVSGSSNVASSPINSNNGISNGSGSVSDAAADIVSEEVASGNSVG